MGILPDKQKRGLRMRREYRELFPATAFKGIHHGTCVTWCMSGSLNRGGGGKRSRHSRRMRNSQFYVSGKMPMVWALFSHSNVDTNFEEGNNCIIFEGCYKSLTLHRLLIFFRLGHYKQIGMASPSSVVQRPESARLGRACGCWENERSNARLGPHNRQKDLPAWEFKPLPSLYVPLIAFPGVSIVITYPLSN